MERGQYWQSESEAADTISPTPSPATLHTKVGMVLTTFGVKQD